MMFALPGWSNKYYINTDQIISIKNTGNDAYPGCMVHLSDKSHIEVSSVSATALADMINESQQT